MPRKRRFSQRFQLAVELELAFRERLSQMHQELLAEKAAQDLYGKEERLSTSNPPLVVRADPTAGDHAVNMRMKMEILTPSVQDSQEADGGAQVLGVPGDRQHRLGHGFEKNAVDSSGVLQRQVGDLLRQRKHHVEILLYGQQLGFPFGQPLGTGRALTLWTAPVSA